MSSLILYIAVSADGFIARTDGSLDWLHTFEGAGEDYGYAALEARVGTVMMGGATYRQVLTFGDYPYRGKVSYVLTRGGISAPAGADVRAYSGDLKALVARIRAESDKDIWLVGGGQVNGALMADDLIDEYIISWMPVVTGGGIPLAQGARVTQTLTLVNVQPFASGVVQVTYRRRR